MGTVGIVVLVAAIVILWMVAILLGIALCRAAARGDAPKREAIRAAAQEVRARTRSAATRG